MSRNTIRRAAVVAATAGVVGAALGGAAPVWAGPEPGSQGSDPFPDIRYYDRLDANSFALPGGIWFRAPTGQNCGIWGLGSFGCAGDIPGAPPGTSHIGWIDGDRAVHYDWSMAVRFPATQALQPLPPHTFVTHQGTTCAVTPDGNTYCERGPLRFLLEPSRTWLSPPWMDLSWIELGPAPCNPPDGGPCYK